MKTTNLLLALLVLLLGTSLVLHLRPAPLHGWVYSIVHQEDQEIHGVKLRGLPLKRFGELGAAGWEYLGMAYDGTEAVYVFRRDAADPRPAPNPFQ